MVSHIWWKSVLWWYYTPWISSCVQHKFSKLYYLRCMSTTRPSWESPLRQSVFLSFLYFFIFYFLYFLYFSISFSQCLLTIWSPILLINSKDAHHNWGKRGGSFSDLRKVMKSVGVSFSSVLIELPVWQWIWICRSGTILLVPIVNLCYSIWSSARLTLCKLVKML